MDSKTIFVRTDKGNEEAAGKHGHLSDDIRRALLMIDGKSTLDEIGKRAAPSLRSALDEVVRILQRGGYIEDSAKAGMVPRMVVPQKKSESAPKLSQEGLEELDFTSVQAPNSEQLAAEAARVEAERRVQAEAEAARKQAEQQVARAREEAEHIKRQAEEEARRRAEAERRARAEAEVARLKAEQEAAKAKAELEAARAHAEAARKRAEQEAEAARKRAEQEAARAREEAERIKRQVEEEARQRAEAERHARIEAEKARLKAEQEAAQAKAELEAARARAEAEAKAREEAERRAREEAEAARKKAEQEAEAARLKAEEAVEAARKQAEQEAARVREEAERIRREAEEEAARIKAELEAAQAKAKAEAKMREEEDRRAREEAEAARLKAEEEAARAREEDERIRRAAEEEAARVKAELEAAQARAEAEAKVREEAEAVQRLAERQAEAARVELEKAEALVEAASPEVMSEAVALAGMEAATAGKPSAGAPARSTSATVLFLDMVGYTKLSVKKQIGIKKRFSQLLAECLAAQQDGDYIVLDTGDGAAIGFLHHPEDALEVAMRFSKAAIADSLKVRSGIHLGPISIVRDMNGQNNMLGDGINDAQRVMGFAGTGQVYVSRSYYDFISRLSDEYASLFHYRGAQNDKHGRSHQLYELIDGARREAEHGAEAADEAMPEIRLEPFSLPLEEPAMAQAPERAETISPTQAEAALESEIAQLARSAKVAAVEPVPQKKSAAAPERAEASARSTHMPSEEEVEALAEAQAKTWAEAERRAQEKASAKAAPAEAPAEKPKKSRARRKPLPWGKIAAVLSMLALVSLFVLPLVLPAEGYVTRVEQLLSARSGQPAQVGKLTWRILPTPQLEVEGVTLGKDKQVQIGRMRADFAFSALFSSVRTIDSLELEGVQVSGGALRETAGWLSQAASDPLLPVRRIGLEAGGLEAQGFTLAGVSGEIEFDAGGRFSKAQLHTEENKYELNLVPAAGKLHTTITLRGAALPLFPDWVFDELNLAGEMSAEELAITDLDGRIAGGMLLGDARIGWHAGWTAEGNLVAKAVGAQNVSKLLDGDLEAKGRFRMSAASLPELPSSARLEGEFVMRKGVINGIDIVETVRLRSSSAPGGRTHFDELTGRFEGAQETFQLRQLVMKAGVMNASGTADVGKRNVNGQLSAELSLRGGTGAVPLLLGGTLDGLTLRLR